MKLDGTDTHPFMSDSRFKSFMPNIVFVVILLSFTPMMVVSGLVLDQFSISYHDKLYAHLQEVVHKHTIEIDSFLNERLNNIQFLLDTCGLEVLSDESFLQERLFQLQQVYGDVFEDLGVVDAEGVQKFYAGRLKLEKAQYSHAKWFAGAINQDAFISDVFLGLRTSPHFIVSVKKTYQGQDYLLKATINFDKFNSLAENLHIGETGFAYILNKEGEFQTKPHYDMLPINKSFPDFIKPNMQSQRDTYSGTFKDNAQQEEMIYVASLLKKGDWVLVYQQKKSEAFADLIHAQISAIVVIFIGAMLIVVMNIILFQKVINRIAKADMEKEMMNRQVIESGKLASVGELAAGIAHEINNPVAIMVQEAGWIGDLLKGDDLKQSKNLEEFNQSLKQIDIQGQRCKDITHKLLSFARKTSPDIEKIQINESITDVVAITNMAAYTNCSMHTDLEANLPAIYGSKTEIQQVIINIINNALHALEKDGGKIDITSRLEGNHVLVIVQDDGPGIPEANLDRIFDPFFTTKPVGQGSGLGLSICFGIINKMGGEIDVHSIIDEGTRFEIRFPIEQQPYEKSVNLPASTSAGSEVMTHKSKKFLEKNIKLLLVDDEKRFVKILAKRLERRNIDVTTTFSGAEAIQALRKVDFDVAVLDLKMEDMGGLEVLKIFKKMYADMEVIILSGHESQQAARDGIKDGAFAYLAKPCEFEELIDTINKAIHVRK